MRISDLSSAVCSSDLLPRPDADTSIVQPCAERKLAAVRPGPAARRPGCSFRPRASHRPGPKEPPAPCSGVGPNAAVLCGPGLQQYPRPACCRGLDGPEGTDCRACAQSARCPDRHASTTVRKRVGQGKIVAVWVAIGGGRIL